MKVTQLNWKKKAKPVLICFIAGATTIKEKTGLFCRSLLNLSPLWWRAPICLWAVVISVLCIQKFWGPRPKFFIYMTNWGLLMIAVESLFGVIVVLKRRRGEDIDATFGLPWYVKTYWVLYNITIPVAFLITVFYWGILRQANAVVTNYAPDPILDIMLHGVNSLVMLVELLCSAHPSRLLHVMQPLYFAGLYMLFTVIYYFAGGLDPWGNTFIYPVIDWSKPEQTLLVITLTALFLALMHSIVVAIATARDAIARRCFRIDPVCDNVKLNTDNAKV